MGDYWDDVNTHETEYENSYSPPPILLDPRPPYITYGLLLINVIVWVAELLLGGSENVTVLVKMGAKENTLITGGEYWRLFTPIFLHAGLDHLLFNSFGLYIWGRYIESLFGKGKYLVIYIVSGLMGSLASYLFSPSVSVGASGAIFGLLGTLLYFRQLNKDLFNRIFGMQVIVIIAVNLFNGFTRSGIDNWGHIGGLFGGYLSAAGMGLLGDRRLRFRKVAAWIGILLLFAAGLYYGQVRYQGEAEKRQAIIYYQDGDYRQAEQYGLLAYRKRPNDRELAKLLSEIYLQQGAEYYNRSQVEEAEKSADLALQYNPGHSRAYALKTLVYIVNGEYGRAEKEAKKCVELEEDYGYGHYLLGYIYYQQGNLSMAEKELDKALEYDPSLEDAQTLLNQLKRTQPSL